MLLDPVQLRANALSSLKRSQKPERMVLLHTGVILLVSLLLTGADYLLDQKIGTTGGLSGMGARSILVTIQSLLRLTQAVVLPFWQIGYTFYSLPVARGQSSGISDLMEGVRRFGPILRLKALMAGMAFLLLLASAYASSFLFMMTPWAMPILQQMESMTATMMNEQELLESFAVMLQDSIVPIMILFGLCFLAGGAFLFFRFRLAELWLLDHPEGGALKALRTSKRLMQGNWKAMFRIDLTFWWFYLLDLLVSILCYGDVILDALGMEMTTDAFGTYLLFFCLYVWAQMALYWWKRNEVAVTYAHAYLTLLPEEPTEEQ